VTALVHEGWNHVQSQRPLAAWGVWQRVLRADPDCAAAKQALAALEAAADLPAAARTPYRFRESAKGAIGTAAADQLGDGGSHDLNTAADFFGRLAAREPGDSVAWYNRALCLAWLGQNVEAIHCLERVVELDAEPAFDRAVLAWTLAEVLRQGGGAESLADDLRFACTIAWSPDLTPWLLGEFPEIQRVPTPRAPGNSEVRSSETEVFEWLDRRFSSPGEGHAEVPRVSFVLASTYAGRQSLRLSSPRAENLERIEEALFPRLGDAVRAVEREATPLPLPFLDADVWTFRIPPGYDRDVTERLTRESVEQYFESEWIHHPRHGLGGLSPLQAAAKALDGDAIARAKLTAVVKLREQLGARPSALLLYQGYPFDRLRRRLGLELDYPVAVDLDDLACASAVELDRLNPASLDDLKLVDAITSAAGLRDDARTGRFSTEFLERKPTGLKAVDLSAVVAPLVRLALSRDDGRGAINLLKDTHALSTGDTAVTLEIWLAEVYARYDEPDAALAIYERLAAKNLAGAVRALDGAETLLVNGHDQQARRLLEKAREKGRREDRSWVMRRAEALLDRIL
jgi:tetratricopeptide (TPR) repeat protein